MACGRSLVEHGVGVLTARRDAARNRARLVAAAREVFAERGLGATLDEVAARAGLGTGTAYRHFRDKHELAAEVLAEATEQIAVDARAALAIDDPWLAIVAFFEATATRQAADRGLYEALAGQGRAADKVRLWPDIVDAVGTVVPPGDGGRGDPRRRPPGGRGVDPGDARPAVRRSRHAA